MTSASAAAESAPMSSQFLSGGVRTGSIRRSSTSGGVWGRPGLR